MKKVFSTLFTEMMNIHLIKDPGMIPFTFNNDFGYKSIIPIFKGRKYPYKDLYFSPKDTIVSKDLLLPNTLLKSYGLYPYTYNESVHILNFQ